MGPSCVVLIWASHVVAVREVPAAGVFPSHGLGSIVQDGLFPSMAGASAEPTVMGGLVRQYSLFSHSLSTYLVRTFSQLGVLRYSDFLNANWLVPKEIPKKPKQKPCSFLRPDFGSHVQFHSILLVRSEFTGPTQSQSQGTVQRWEF